ncbi:DUF4385 domain-containing protein [Nitrosovibrio tenuis]|uniref:Cytoplasmic protein n=1 Tax=Nitrosovibrio tenuis TaxID=1233 RepID=A0A1H7NS24_9PROT|nr:DUF4385 domain-containing protein [Nitrosovibrio tenuis]SEL26312.1 protein of unknown function [Nitrosovibrio tenuis]
MEKKREPSYLTFDKDSYAWKPDIDYHKEQEKYRVGKGEQGVLICEPYKSKLAPHWRFKTPDMARNSSAVLYSMFEAYLKAGDFVGADMARKFLQMGYTRARRYANYKAGIKYDRNNDYALKEKGTGDPSKAESAAIFYEKWKQAEAHPEYAIRRKAWREQYG